MHCYITLGRHLTPYVQTRTNVYEFIYEWKLDIILDWGKYGLFREIIYLL